jgi:hypothetical protein
MWSEPRRRVSRRRFLTGRLVAALGLSGAGALQACASRAPAPAEAIRVPGAGSNATAESEVVS